MTESQRVLEKIQELRAKLAVAGRIVGILLTAEADGRELTPEGKAALDHVVDGGIALLDGDRVTAKREFDAFDAYAHSRARSRA